jgi:phage protein U
MLYQLGAVSFEVAPLNVHAVDFTAGADFAEKPVIGIEPPLESVGEGVNAWTLTGRLFPHTFGGLPDLERLHQMRVAGLPQYLMRGDGRPLGWVVITSIAERASYLDETGVGRQVDVTISLRRAGPPAIGSFFSILADILR